MSLDPREKQIQNPFPEDDLPGNDGVLPLQEMAWDEAGEGA